MVVATAGVTGMKESMETRVEGLISMLKGVTDKSVAVGFGVSRPDQVRVPGAQGCRGGVNVLMRVPVFRASAGCRASPLGCCG